VTRRTLLSSLPAAGLLAQTRTPRILVRSGWQWENIGDIAHTPGLIALLEKHIPEARVTLFSAGLGGGARDMLQGRFPRLAIIESLDLTPGGPLEKAFDESHVLIHGSSAGVQRQHLDLWRKRSSKPYGLFGVTVSLTQEAASPKLDDATKSALDSAAFLYTRETHSLANVRSSGVKAKTIDFAPDATFSMDVADEPAAKAYLARTGLAEKPFIAVIPRLRYTPYHEFKKPSYGPEEAKRRDEINNRHKHEDAAKLREVVVAWVRKTGGRVLLCAEMTYELGMIGPLLYDPLPDDVKRNVVPRKEYWLPGEASSIYRHARAVVSCECHSPIMALFHGTPAFYIRQPEDTIKGQMYADLGVGDWAPHIEQTSAQALVGLVISTLSNPDEARRRARAAAAKAQTLQARAMAHIRTLL
jgi:polysaccharide pyruvyl transferase WcaK-like protein